MNIFDITGPVMVGPSSSHTAGAVKIGNVCRKLTGEKITEADILLHGSFLATGRGHGTDKALVAGLMGFAVDDSRIPDSFRIAEEEGLKYRFGAIDLGEEAHPNSVRLNLTSKSGRKLEVQASSIGGGRIMIVHNLDQPGHVAEVTSMLEHKSVNIATMQLYRSGRGGHAVMVIECDQEIPRESLKWLEHLEGIEKVTYYSLQEL